MMPESESTIPKIPLQAKDGRLDKSRLIEDHLYSKPRKSTERQEAMQYFP
jgi:hypothetical protein